MLTDTIIDELALEGLNVVAAARGVHSYHYDITGYERIHRLDTPFGTSGRSAAYRKTSRRRNVLLTSLI